MRKLDGSIVIKMRCIEIPFSVLCDLILCQIEKGKGMFPLRTFDDRIEPLFPRSIYSTDFVVCFDISWHKDTENRYISVIVVSRPE